ncbi:hypothetical protein AB4Y45_33720 [Paraburkholderia sp. EG287A]|uniref:hypothetical protein n=1 Tax=Paraburkholderia sp. EG287A TaxID=3237012 RepID=UPI0034D284FD
MYGIVVSVASLPVPHRDMTSLTSVRVRTEEGISAYFFENTPLAPTLVKGEWVEFTPSCKEWGGSLSLLDKYVLAELARAKSAGAVCYFLECVKLAAGKFGARGVLRDMPEGKDLEQVAKDLYRGIDDTRARFALNDPREFLPDEILFRHVPDALMPALYWYCQDFRAALDAPTPLGVHA